MISQTAIEAMGVQNDRLTTMIRNIDGGIWWQTDANAKVEAGKILAQTARIGDALDAIERLVKGMAT
ncbi:hypothetical protein [Methylobacterium sp. J-092]|uniref:hypothetical protein n=1 Tax=Methylobacterium sp. J-092 TaxID=2836667 RepID=UPI001FB95947|nr:hypothetical protein [Methylobacterium sp. J-092]MCJ2006131.1 hypothetical protein [Methylobacterium sp. J-092]